MLNAECHKEALYSECHKEANFMLTVVMLNVGVPQKGYVQDGQIFEFVETLRPFSWQTSLARGINNDPTVWSDGTRPSPSTFSTIISVQRA